MFINSVYLKKSVYIHYAYLIKMLEGKAVSVRGTL